MHRPLGCAALILFLLVWVAPVRASSSQPPTTFADVVSQSKLIVLVAIRHPSAGGWIFTVEEVFKGEAPPTMTFPPLDTAPPLDGWARAVIAFHDPTSLDFRVPTYAWHVTADGRLDPERFQQVPGVPQTLGELEGYFGLPATDTSPDSGGPPVTTWLGAFLLVGGIAAFARARVTGPDLAGA